MQQVDAFQMAAARLMLHGIKPEDICRVLAEGCIKAMAEVNCLVEGSHERSVRLVESVLGLFASIMKAKLDDLRAEREEKDEGSDHPM